MRRPLVFLAIASTAIGGATAACDSFEEGSSSSAPDGAADDAADGAPNESGSDAIPDTGSNDSATAHYCDGKRDAGVFCFDFDTDPLTPTWVPITEAEGGIATVTIEDASFASAPNAGSFVIKQTASGSIASTAVLTRSATGVDVAHGVVELDVAIGQISSTTSIAYVVVSSTTDSGGYDGCFFGVNAEPQGGAALYVTSRAADGGYLSQAKSDVLTNKFTHVTLEWRSKPRSVALKVGDAAYELPAADCVRSSAYVVSFGAQSETGPIDTQMYIDNITYELKP